MPLFLDRAAVEQLLPMGECIEAMRQAHLAFSAGRTVMPVRLTATFGDVGLLRAMPAWLDDGPALGMKSITNFPGHKPPILATMLLYDPGTGALLAVMDGVHLTNVRTAAASAVATQALARPGVEPARAGRRRRPGRRPPRGDGPRAAARAGHRDGANTRIGGAIRGRAGAALPAARAPRDDALPGADVVCTVSSAREPGGDGGMLERGTHLNAVGSHAPTIREIAGEVMRDARVVVDSREATLSECGDCLLPIADGLFGPEHVSDELGEVLAGAKPGRSSAAEITIYQSCGIAVQDVAAAQLVYDRARSLGIGIDVEL